ncbi:toxin YoeB [Marinicella pacifica]|uniref:Putative mRNA interferase YoeB n=1 Tax=Marinicella pacifica TaxID=1171543 RepID=A0A917FIU0_9GAMM|nr:Txe/YoeB family addiction module toxin [Marinicella pacifica]GGF86293.1 toxin YoeB [Marinicella pacifica]
MKITFSQKAWEDYLDWQRLDKKKFKRINTLIKSISRTPFEGLGDPEPLKHDWSGYWSRRIDIKNRLVYRVTDNQIIIAQCKYHY